MEAAPVTVSSISGNIGYIVEALPVDTNIYGIAEFTLNVTSAGQAVLRATVEDLHTSANYLVVTGVAIPDTQRSLLTQYEQIRRSTLYNDTIPDVNTSDVAEPATPTVSGTSTSVLGYDLNVLRTLIKQIKGTSNWYDDVPSYFNPSNTDATNIETGTASLEDISGNTLDSKTIITAVTDDNSGAGFIIAYGDAGFLFNVSTKYSTIDDRRGIQIYQSATNSGTYYDEGGEDVVVRVDLINLDTGTEFKDLNGDIIFARFHDGIDFSGSGDGVDAYIKFYTESAPYTTVSGDPTSVMLIFPVRRVMSELEEYKWPRTAFVSSWKDSNVFIDHISDLWSFTGSSDNEITPTWSISGSSMISGSDDSLWEAINSINTEFGSLEFTESNYISSGQSITNMLDSFDMVLYDVVQETARVTAEKYVQTLVSGISSGAAYQLPNGLSYTPNSNIGRQGSNMDIYLDGWLLSANTGVSGINSDRDYAEIDTTHIAFNFEVFQDSDITYVIRA